MPISDLLSRRVRARPDEADADSEIFADGASSDSGSFSNEDEPDSESSGGADSDSNDANDIDDAADAEDDPEGEDEDASDDNDIHSTLNTISFGALAKAQESLGPKKKLHRSKHHQPSDPNQPTPSPLDDIRARLREARQQKQSQSRSHKSKDSSTREKRSSKHAPTVQSSKRAVSRKRPVIDLSFIPKARDPRFDPAVLSQSGSASHHNPQAAKEAYAFLDDYRNSELKDLKARLAKTKDPVQKEALKREVRSAGDRLRSIQNKKREEEVMAEHKKREKQLIREGKKSTPYYLKRSDLKQQALVKKYQDMGSRERAKALERRRKKATAKERKDMPMERRGVGDATEEESSRKRKRV